MNHQDSGSEQLLVPVPGFTQSCHTLPPGSSSHPLTCYPLNPKKSDWQNMARDSRPLGATKSYGVRVTDWRVRFPHCSALHHRATWVVGSTPAVTGILGNVYACVLLPPPHTTEHKPMFDGLYYLRPYSQAGLWPQLRKHLNE